MERRNFIQSTVALLATSSITLPVFAQNSVPLKKGFKVKALATGYKEKIVYGKTPIDFKLLSNDTQNQLSIFISTNNLKGFGPPLHIHHTFDEFFCVLEGDFLFELDDRILTLTKGDSLFIPKNTKHRFNYNGETAGTLLVGITPAKEIEKYFADMGKLLTNDGVPDMVKMQALYKTYNSEILGPPMK